MSSYLDTLNERQREAVVHGMAPLLILAGAGSGKTRVVTTRIAWLIDEMEFQPDQILAVTFTNKAAREMQERVGRLVALDNGSPMVKTFHLSRAPKCCREQGLPHFKGPHTWQNFSTHFFSYYYSR